MTPGFRLLLNRYAMIGFERQLAIIDRLGDDPEWTLSPREGRATFDGKPFPIQLLGTRSADSNTWLWAWANEASGVPATALDAARKIRNVGRKRSIGELAVESLPLDNFDFDAHTLALIATSVAEMPAYFRFPYETGALFAAIEIPDFTLGAARVPRIARVITEATSRFDIDHRTALTAYIEARGGRVTGDRRTPKAVWPDGQALNVQFDENDHLVQLARPEEGDSGVVVH
jgi:hypothetical protein